MSAANFTTVTETPGVGATAEQLAMLYARYKHAAMFCEGKAVLEVACGAGQGLGYLAKNATVVVGGDFEERLVRVAQHHYRDRVPLLQFDAHALPFRSRSFDTILLFEAIYYLAHPEQFLAECTRVLRADGTLLICTVNREWEDFNPSPFSTRYFSARELAALLSAHGFHVELFGGFPVKQESARDVVVSVIKRAAVALHLVPKTMKGKQLLKRIFLGKLAPLPAEVTEDMAVDRPPELLAQDTLVSGYKVLYAVARLP
jgi:ubiquinone/menaquinone biosynthesis C-methylase UbiE